MTGRGLEHFEGRTYSGWHPAADQLKGACLGLSLYAVLRELQALLATCTVCDQHLYARPRASTNEALPGTRSGQVWSHRCTRHTVVTRGRLRRGLGRASRIGTARVREEPSLGPLWGRAGREPTATRSPRSPSHCLPGGARRWRRSAAGHGRRSTRRFEMLGCGAVPNLPTARSSAGGIRRRHVREAGPHPGSCRPDQRDRR
jgi:hypothetical protein